MTEAFGLDCRQAPNFDHDFIATVGVQVLQSTCTVQVYVHVHVHVHVCMCTCMCMWCCSSHLHRRLGPLTSKHAAAVGSFPAETTRHTIVHMQLCVCV